MAHSLVASSGRKRLPRALVALAVVAALAGFSAGNALAFHCYVEDKPDGAGAFATGPDDAFQAGKSDKLVVKGAFGDVSEFGLPDVFIRGPQNRDDDIQGVGELPHEPHHNGGSDHGVQEIH